jgi:Pilus formation protein N terminal region
MCKSGRHVFALALALAVSLGLRGAHADTLTVVLDQAQIIRLPEGVGTIIVGNPLIADVSLQSGGIMVATGKGYGSTNITTLDRAGATLTSTTVQVVRAPDAIVVYRGVDRESYSCASKCEKRITLGDAPPYFDATLHQAHLRNARSIAGAAP